MPPFFIINQTDKNTSARAGVLHTDHGDIPTPCFMPVGTYGTVKAMTTEEVESKARDLLTPVLGIDKTNHLIKAVGDLESMGSVRQLRKLLRP